MQCSSWKEVYGKRRILEQIKAYPWKLKQKRFLKLYIWSILFYGSKTWTISTEIKIKVRSYGNVVLPQNSEHMERKSLKPGGSQTSEQKQIIKLLTQRQLRHLGHII